MNDPLNPAHWSRERLDKETLAACDPDHVANLAPEPHRKAPDPFLADAAADELEFQSTRDWQAHSDIQGRVDREFRFSLWVVVGFVTTVLLLAFGLPIITTWLRTHQWPL